MNARTVRLSQTLVGEADAYAESLGISFNALAAVALREYLDARKTLGTTPAPAAQRQPPEPALPTSDRHAAVPRVGAGRVKAGRNEPCPCGSGQKFKRCHGVAGSETS